MSKRGQNEGSIFEEKPGRWVATLSLGYQITKGKRRRIRKKFVAQTRREVQVKLTAALRSQQQGIAVPIQRQTLGAFLNHWLDQSAKRRVTESTLASYRWLVDKHIAPEELGRVTLAKLQPAAIDAFINLKLSAGLSPRTVQYLHGLIRNALNDAERGGLVARNVAKLVSAPKQTEKDVQPLQPDEARKLLDFVEGDRLEALYSVALSIGLRRGESLGLFWTDLDEREGKGTLRIERSLQRIGGKLKFTEPKRDSKRTIPLPSFALSVLGRHRERQAQEKRFAGEKWKEHGLIFPSSVGTPFEPRNLVRHLHTKLAALKITRHRFHDLRHTAASLLLAQGVTLHEVKEILGHSQISLTADLYGHIYPTVMRSAIEKIEGVLGPSARVAPSVAPSTGATKPN